MDECRETNVISQNHFQEFMKFVTHLAPQGRNEMKSKELLDDFISFCKENPSLRFWQALAAWADGAIWRRDFSGNSLEDTYYFEGKDK
jgi:hypothetical protein